MEARCQVFTPESIAFYMLDLIGYKGNVYGKKVIENSCGGGNILCAIVSRYIEGLYGQTSQYIKNGLERDIVGYDVDDVCCEKTITKLNDVARKYGIENVVWNVSSRDTLSCNIEQEYDFVIGNPPYISYRHLEKEHRDFLRENYSSCKVGAFDEDMYEHELFSAFQVFNYNRYLNENNEQDDVHKKIVRVIEIYKKRIIECERELTQLLERRGENADIDSRILELDSELEATLDGTHALSQKVKRDLSESNLLKLVECLDKLLEGND